MRCLIWFSSGVSFPQKTWQHSFSVEFRNGIAQELLAQLWWVSRWTTNKNQRLRKGLARVDCSELCPVRSWTSPGTETSEPLSATHSTIWQPLHLKKRGGGGCLSFKQNFLYISFCPLSGKLRIGPQTSDVVSPQLWKEEGLTFLMTVLLMQPQMLLAFLP